jgi:hypothetical protein
MNDVYTEWFLYDFNTFFLEQFEDATWGTIDRIMTMAPPKFTSLFLNFSTTKKKDCAILIHVEAAVLRGFACVMYKFCFQKKKKIGPQLSFAQHVRLFLPKKNCGLPQLFVGLRICYKLCKSGAEAVKLELC